MVLDQIEMLWMQKERVEAIRDGDRNTWYYHTSTVVRRKVNRIEMLQEGEGNWVSDSQQISRMVRTFFVGLYYEEQPLDTTEALEGGLFPHITGARNERWQSLLR